MIKRTLPFFLVLVGIGAVVWLSGSYKLVRVETTASGQSQAANLSDQAAADSSAGSVTGASVPESARHAADEIDRHRQSSLAELDQAVRDQEAKVEERRKVLATIVRTKGIIYRGPDASYGAGQEDADSGAGNAFQLYQKLEVETMQLESQITSLLKYDGQQLIRYAAGLDLPDNAVSVLQLQYMEASRELELLQKRGLGERHPTVVAKSEEVRAMESQLNEGVIQLRNSLKARLDSAREQLKKAGEMKEANRQEAIKRATDAQDYVDAKREFESDQQLLQELKLKQISEKVKSGR